MTIKSLKALLTQSAQPGQSGQYGNEKNLTVEHVAHIAALLRQKILNPNQLLVEVLLMIRSSTTVKKSKYHLILIGFALRSGASANAYLNIANYSEPIHILVYLYQELAKSWRDSMLTKIVASLLLVSESDLNLPVFYNKSEPIIGTYLKERKYPIELSEILERSESSTGQILKYVTHLLDQPELCPNLKLSLRLSIKYYAPNCFKKACELKPNVPSHQYLIWTVSSFNFEAYSRLLEYYDFIPYWLINQILLAIEKNRNMPTSHTSEYIAELLVDCLKTLIRKKISFDPEQWIFIQRLQLDTSLMNYYYSIINDVNTHPKLSNILKLPKMRLDVKFNTGYLDLATYQDQNGRDWYYSSSEFASLRETKINPVTKQELPSYFLDQLRKQQYFNKRLSLLTPCSAPPLDLITSNESDRIINLLTNIGKLHLPTFELKSLSFKFQIKILTDLLGSEKIVKFFSKHFYLLSPKLKLLTFAHLCYQILKDRPASVLPFIKSYSTCVKS